ASRQCNECYWCCPFPWPIDWSERMRLKLVERWPREAFELVGLEKGWCFRLCWLEHPLSYSRWCWGKRTARSAATRSLGLSPFFRSDQSAVDPLDSRCCWSVRSQTRGFG